MTIKYIVTFFERSRVKSKLPNPDKEMAGQTASFVFYEIRPQLPRHAEAVAMDLAFDIHFSALDLMWTAGYMERFT